MVGRRGLMESRWVGRNKVVGNYRCPEWYGIVADSTQRTGQKKNSGDQGKEVVSVGRRQIR